MPIVFLFHNSNLIAVILQLPIFQIANCFFFSTLWNPVPSTVAIFHSWSSLVHIYLFKLNIPPLGVFAQPSAFVIMTRINKRIRAENRNFKRQGSNYCFRLGTAMRRWKIDMNDILFWCIIQQWGISLIFFFSFLLWEEKYVLFLHTNIFDNLLISNEPFSALQCMFR